MEQLGDTRDEYYDIFNVYWPIGVAVFAVVALLVAYVVWRFRSDADEFPEGRSESKAEELYAGGIAVIVAGLLVLTFMTMDDMSPASDAHVGDGPRIEVTAARWNWRFFYPDYGIVEQGTRRQIPTLYVPVDTPVRFTTVSLDVIHSFWIPERRFKRDAFPSREIEFTMRFDEEGFMRRAGECAEYCGLDHAIMSFNVNVLGKDEFERWARERGREDRLREDLLEGPAA